jgi:hypothetical protein
MLVKVLALAVLATPALAQQFKGVGTYQVYSPFTSAAPGSNCVAVIFSVGTSMNPDKYSKFSAELVKQGLVAAIMDPQPGSLFKNDETKSAAAVKEIRANLAKWANCASVSKFIGGGHSAGGGAMHRALIKDAALVDGVFSVDPYEIKSTDKSISTPALYWGYDQESCQVKKSSAAQAAFDRSSSARRTFYRVSAMKGLGSSCKAKPLLNHCSITDSGCMFCTTCDKATPQFFYQDVAATIKAFAANAFAVTWDTNFAWPNITTDTTQFFAPPTTKDEGGDFAALGVEETVDVTVELPSALPVAPMAGAFVAGVAVAGAVVAVVAVQRRRSASAKTMSVSNPVNML